MIIVEKTERALLCYHDGVFIYFDRQALVVNDQFIGVAWAAGKTDEPLNIKPEVMISNSVYHNILISTLLDSV